MSDGWARGRCQYSFGNASVGMGLGRPDGLTLPGPARPQQGEGWPHPQRNACMTLLPIRAIASGRANTRLPEAGAWGWWETSRPVGSSRMRAAGQTPSDSVRTAPEPWASLPQTRSWRVLARPSPPRSRTLHGFHLPDLPPLLPVAHVPPRAHRAWRSRWRSWRASCRGSSRPCHGGRKSRRHSPARAEPPGAG